MIKIVLIGSFLWQGNSAQYLVQENKRPLSFLRTLTKEWAQNVQGVNAVGIRRM